MNKTALIDAVQDQTGYPKTQIDEILCAAGLAIAAHLSSADAGTDATAALPMLGKLKTITRAARTCRNPQTGAPIEIPERVVVKFIASRGLHESLNP